MKLHTNTVEGKAGLIFKKPAYYMSFRLELSEAEQRHLDAHAEIGKLTVGTGMFGVGSPMEIAFNVNMCVKGNDRAEFASLGLQTQFEQSLREGCTQLKEHFVRLEQIAGGPSVTEF